MTPHFQSVSLSPEPDFQLENIPPTPALLPIAFSLPIRAYQIHTTIPIRPEVVRPRRAMQILSETILYNSNADSMPVLQPSREESLPQDAYHQRLRYAKPNAYSPSSAPEATPIAAPVPLTFRARSKDVLASMISAQRDSASRLLTPYPQIVN